MAVRVTLDTNIYVSAFHFGGMRLLLMAVSGDIEIAVSQPDPPFSDLDKQPAADRLFQHFWHLSASGGFTAASTG